MVKDRVPALLLYARRVPGRRGSWVETLGAALGGVPTLDGKPSPWGRLFSFLDRNAYTSLSYVNDWLAAFGATPELDLTVINIVNRLEWSRLRAAVRRCRLIIVLHSAAGDDISLLSRFRSLLVERRGPLLVFFGNEYTAMREKIDFARTVNADYVASQLPPVAARWLYEECPNTRVLLAPAALNPERFVPMPGPRSCDLGFRGDRYPLTIGDDERTRVLEIFARNGARWRLNVDIAFERIAGPAWRAFLNRCHGTVGAEAGTYYLERDDLREGLARSYCKRHPAVTATELHARFFDRSVGAVSGKAISSRHFEAIGTKTCQILLEGEYNGILIPDRHYLSLRRDFANLEDVVARFKDPQTRESIADAAYAHVVGAHTYRQRVAQVLNTVFAGGVHA